MREQFLVTKVTSTYNASMQVLDDILHLNKPQLHVRT